MKYWLLISVISYLAGCIPTGYLLGRLRGIDIRRHGSGNIGATNVFRCLGKKLGTLTLITDVLKGLLPVLVVRFRLGQWFEGMEIEAAMLAAAFAVMGHVWPVTMRFRGGKGVATAAGGMLGAVPLAVAPGLVAWIVLFLLSGYVSLASMVAAIVVAVAGWLVYGGESLLAPAVVSFLAMVALWRHRGNMRRLMNRTESRFRIFRRHSQNNGD